MVRLPSMIDDGSIFAQLNRQQTAYVSRRPLRDSRRTTPLIKSAPM